ncbi:MAG: GNAT family N-acetyltransferase [candidate division NC10 bacterium]|nr:GNAT family N-acetyltransferase [candidate division NC10 bacterium]
MVIRLALPNCIIRSWQPADAGAIVRHANDRRIWLNLRDRFPHPYTPTDADRWIRDATSAPPETQFAIAVGGEAAGGIGLELRSDVCRGSAEIGYWLGAAYWGRGIATEAVRAVTAYGFSRLGLRRIFAGVFEWNPSSMRVLEKAGYSLEGRLRQAVLKDGRVLDAFLYAIVRDSGPEGPRAG